VSSAFVHPGRPWFSRPRRDRLLGHPDRQAAALAQAGVIRRPVRDVERLLGNVVASVGVQLEGQDGIQGQTGTNLLPRPGLGRHQADPCNNAAGAAKPCSARSSQAWLRDRSGTTPEPDKSQCGMSSSTHACKVCKPISWRWRQTLLLDLLLSLRLSWRNLAQKGVYGMPALHRTASCRSGAK